jgi:glycosyltransferase involved in cell wall biosynthesis
MYQGVLNIGRGIDLMIQAMLYLPEFELWIAGGGDVEQDLKELCANLALENRVKFLGKLPAKTLHKTTEQAFIGLSLEENLGLNYYYALPNKLFDYIQAQVPAVVSDLPEMRDLVTTYKTGKILYERTPVALATLIKELADNKLLYDKLKKNNEIAADVLCWESEKPKLLAIFNEALKKC